MRFLNETRSRDTNLSVDGPRRDGRANLATAVLVVPQVDGALLVEQSFAAVTKDFSAEGMSLILAQPLSADTLVIGVRHGELMTFLQGDVIYKAPIGAQFFQAGLRVERILDLAEHPELNRLCSCG